MDFCKLNYILLGCKTFLEIFFFDLEIIVNIWAFGHEDDWWIYYTCEQEIVWWLVLEK